MSLEKIAETEHPLMVGRCSCSEYTTFIYVDKQELTPKIQTKLGVKYLELYNCVKCGTTTTEQTIRKNGRY